MTASHFRRAVRFSQEIAEHDDHNTEQAESVTIRPAVVLRLQRSAVLCGAVRCDTAQVPRAVGY